MTRWLAFLLIGLATGPPVAAQMSNHMVVRLEDSTSGSAALAVWDEVDAALDLTGLWGSIDPQTDIDPAWTIRPEDGTTYLVWSEWTGLYYRLVYASRPPGGSWTGVLDVESTASSTYDNVASSVVTDSSGRLHVAWVREADGGDVVMHSVRIGGPWTVPLVISGTEEAGSPRIYLHEGVVRVDFVAADVLVTVEIVIYESSGGSDDVDPGTDVEVETTEVGNEFLPQ